MKNRKILLIGTIAILIIAVAIIATTFNIDKEIALANTVTAGQPYYYWGGGSYIPTSGQPSSSAENANNSSTFSNLVITCETDQEFSTIEYISLQWTRWYTSSTNRVVRYTIYDNINEATSIRYIRWEWKQTGSTSYSRYLYNGKRVNGSWEQTQITNLLIKFSSNDGSLSNNTTWGETFLNDIMPTLSTAYNVVNNCQHLTVYPTMIRKYSTSTPTNTIIRLYPDTGYKLPDGVDFEDYIQFNFTALDGVYYPEYGQFIVSNNQSNFIITGSLPRDITVYNLTWNITNGTGAPSIITEGTTTTLTITPNNGFNIPATITYNGTALDVQYYSDTGDIVITNPTSDATITAICEPTAYLLKAGYYIPDIRVLETVRALERSYIGIEVPHYLSKGLGEIVTAQPEDSYYRYNIIDTNFSNGDVYRGGILFDCRQQYLGIWATDTVNEIEAQRQEHIVSYDALNTSFSYTDLYLMYVPNDTNIPYYARDFFVNMGNYITFYALPTSIYTIGVTDGENTSIIGGTSTSVISQIFNALFGQIFAVEIFPGFPLYIFILIPVVFGIIGLLLWLIRGK